MKVRSSMIDKELRATGLILKAIMGSFSESRLRLLNKLMKKVRLKIRDDSIQFSEAWIPRKDGSRMRVCIFRPLTPKKSVPGVLWLHGGGYAIGTAEQAGARAKCLIEAHHCVVVAPNYRLSVEAPYPAALEDSYDALLWMKSHANELGIRDDQLMVGGESAGGGLTAALTVYTRDKAEVSIAFQMPLYPMVDDRMTSESARDNNAPVWDSKSNFIGWKLYLGSLFGTDHVPAYAAPARVTDYNNLPPTVTFVGDLEPFRDEVVQYVDNLRNAGIPVEFEMYKGCYHAFELMCPTAEISRKAISFFMSAFKYAVEHYYAEQPSGIS